MTQRLTDRARTARYVEDVAKSQAEELRARKRVLRKERHLAEVLDLGLYEVTDGYAGRAQLDDVTRHRWVVDDLTFTVEEWGSDRKSCRVHFEDGTSDRFNSLAELGRVLERREES